MSQAHDDMRLAIVEAFHSAIMAERAWLNADSRPSLRTKAEVCAASVGDLRAWLDYYHPGTVEHLPVDDPATDGDRPVWVTAVVDRWEPTPTGAGSVECLRARADALKAEQRAIDLMNAAFDVAESHGWNYQDDEDWQHAIYKATAEEILAEGLQFALRLCRFREGPPTAFDAPSHAVDPCPGCGRATVTAVMEQPGWFCPDCGSVVL